jgi:hypothetical protein
MAELGTVGTGMAELGAVGTGMAGIGTTGTAIGIVAIMSSLLEVSASRGGGAGALLGVGALPGAGAVLGATRTVTMADMVLEIPAMATTVTVTDMDMDMDTARTANTVLAVNTTLRLGREWLSCNGDSPAPAIITDQLMAF